MKIKNIKILVSVIIISYIIIVIAALFFGVSCGNKLKEQPIKQDLKAYKIKVINEHEVQGVSGKDTVYLYFENAYKLSEERVVYIEW